MFVYNQILNYNIRAEVCCLLSNSQEAAASRSSRDVENMAGVDVVGLLCGILSVLHSSVQSSSASRGRQSCLLQGVIHLVYRVKGG